MSELDDLEAKAKAASWIQWPTDPEDPTFVEDLGDDACAFIAVASPARVLSLIAGCQERDELRKEMSKRFGGGPPWP